MQDIFTKEEESRLNTIIKDYRVIYADASVISLKMEKLKEDMKSLSEKMTSLREEETAIYVNSMERSGLTIEEIHKKAAELVMQYNQEAENQSK